MTKGQGYTAAGAVLLAGLLFHGSMSFSPSQGADKARESVPSARKPVSEEGPWLASCRYWAVVQPQSPETAPPPLAGGAPENKPACSRSIDTWGIPVPSSSASPDIHVIIATVSDPVHTHLALEFDRSIDALLQAASDNGYLASYYWLPWPGPSSPLSAAQPSEADQDTQRRREQQPGLIILKYNPSASEPNAATTGFYRVVYLFLVAESPALGVNGEQLRNALQYESWLHSDPYLASLSMSGRSDDKMAFIGPHWSGSASSLRQALLLAKTGVAPSQIVAAGSTSTEVAQCEINAAAPNLPPHFLSYQSFGEDPNFEEQQLRRAFDQSFSEATRTAVLVEDNTVFGAASLSEHLGPDDPALSNPCTSPTPTYSQHLAETLYIRFPREISLLRNAQTEQGNSPSTSSQAPSPYLSLSLKDPGADDMIPKFSTTQTALSQEAVLMEIERQLQKAHVRHILITASNILDEIFLARELRRACPDASIVFYDGSDLLLERDVDNAPYIGSLSVSPFSLLTFDRSANGRRIFPDSRSASIYDAASYIFWLGSKRVSDPDDLPLPHLAGTFRRPDNAQQFALMVTTVGADGYYPLGILNPCSSDSTGMLLNIDGAKATPCPTRESVSIPQPELPMALPTLSWFLLCALLITISTLHTVAIHSGKYWSPSTRDLAIQRNDQPRRRSLYIHIATSMLVCISLVLTIPWFAIGWNTYPRAYPRLSILLVVLAIAAAVALCRWKIYGYLLRPRAAAQTTTPYQPSLWVSLRWPILAALVLILIVIWLIPNSDKTHSWSPWLAAILTLCSVVSATAATLLKTHPYWKRSPTAPPGHQSRLYPWFNWTAVAATGVVFVLMVLICTGNRAPWGPSYVGLFFSYRSLHPISGVSPIVPILLLLFAWYLWATFQTARLRFSTMNRPRLPGHVESATTYPLYVTDQSLQNCRPPIPRCLIEDIDSLLITRELVGRFTHLSRRKVDWSLLLLYLVLFFACAFGLHIESLERFLHPGHYLTLYEWLIAIFFYPLVMIALSGWIRSMLIWSELQDGLLAPLERMPFRHAFSRVSEVDWVTMLGQSGLGIRWRDMARSTESIRQIMNNPEILREIGWNTANLQAAANELHDQIEQLIIYMAGGEPLPQFGHELPPGEYDLPLPVSGKDLSFIYAIEQRYAAFGEQLLEYILIPYWNTKRVGFVNDVESKDHTPYSGSEHDPLYIRLAEEFLVIRYVAFIRTVLVNIRHLMLFVSMAFVLAIVAWNSYPFQPRQQLDWYFTILMLCLSAGFVWVFAQMHRNPILSRITSTTPGELGSDFYIRLVTFGAVPVLTWLAYQFPEVGGSLFRLLQPSLQVAR